MSKFEDDLMQRIQSKILNWEQYFLPKMAAHAAEVERLTGERDEAERARNYLYDGVNKALHSNGGGPERPAGCDLVGYLKHDLQQLREERDSAVRERDAARKSLVACQLDNGTAELIVSRDFVAEARRIKKTAARIMQERDAAVEALRGLVSSVDALVSDSYGVVGLHLNGDVAPWDELLQGGRYEEWLAALEDARAILAGHAPATPQQVTPHRTTLLDQLETGPWPSFVRDVKAISETPATKGEGDE